MLPFGQDFSKTREDLSALAVVVLFKDYLQHKKDEIPE